MKTRLFLLPTENQTSEDYLKDFSMLANWPHYYIHGQPVSPAGEIAIPDNKGVMQFLSPSILSGNTKYDPATYSGKGAPKMALFSTGLERLDELYIVGYGFGDIHINNRIARAMHRNDCMKIFVIDPVNTRPKALNAFDYGIEKGIEKMRVRGISGSAVHSLRYLETGQWHSKEEVAKIEAVWKQRTEIYENLYGNIFKRD